jgi:hypothetical protein
LGEGGGEGAELRGGGAFGRTESRAYFFVSLLIASASEVAEKKVFEEEPWVALTRGAHHRLDGSAHQTIQRLYPSSMVRSLSVAFNISIP